MPALLIYAVVAYASGYMIAGAVASGLYQAYEQRRQRKKADRRARDEYNAALTDRTVMVDITPNAPRTIPLGRVRTVEGVRRRWASGTHDEKLTLIVSFAGCEIDAFETFYFDDVALTLDGSGYVQTAPYLKTANTSQEHSLLLNGSGGGSYTIPGTLVSGSVTAICEALDGTAFHIGVSMAGNVATLSGGTAGGSATVHWQSSAGTSLARIRTYLGTDAQTVGADLAAEYPGKISASDDFAGIALAVVDLTYDPDVYPQGVPTVTALLRGAKVLDPRTAVTAWSENPMLHAYHYARLANGWAVPAANIAEADIEAGANECDISTVYTLRMPDTSTVDVTMPRYRCGIVINTAADPRGVMDEIMETMAGRWGWAGGVLRMRAGMSAAPVFELDTSWVAQRLNEDGRPADASVVRITNGVPRDQRYNLVTGTCVDPDQRWQAQPFPSVADAVLIAADGEERALEMELQGVNHIAHAQHLATVAVREAQAGLRIQVACNLRAYRCELFDVGEITLPRYGFAGKLAEVVGWRWAPRVGVQLNLAETSADIYDNDELDGRDPAPNSDLPRLTTVEQILGLAVDSSATTLADGSLLTRTQASWTAATSDAVRQGGHVEVQYTPANATLPSGDWPSRVELGNTTSTTIAGLRQGHPYLFRARAVTSLGVRGKWSRQVSHVITLRSKLFRAIAKGNSDTQAPASPGFYVGDTATRLYSSVRSYNMARVRRSDAAVTFQQTYDVYGAGAGTAGRDAATLAADLDATDSDAIVVVWTYDEPLQNRLTGGLDEAMYRCGASRAIFGSPQFKLRAAYVLVGIGGCGEGNGYEAYNGAVASDTNAWADAAFLLIDGQLIVTGSTAVPRTLADHGYSGDLDATRDITLLARGNCSVSGNNAFCSGGGAWGSGDVYSADAYTGGAFCAAIPASGVRLMMALNQDPTTDQTYTGLDRAIYFVSNTFFVYESGANVYSGGAYSAGDVFAIVYDGYSVQYLRNGATFYTSAATIAANIKYFFDSAFYDAGFLNAIRFGPLSKVAEIDTGQVLSGAITDQVTVEDSGPIDAIGGDTELVRATFGPYPVATDVQITFVGQVDLLWGTTGPANMYANAYIDLSAGASSQTVKSDSWYDTNAHQAVVSLTHTMSLAANTTGWARAMGNVTVAGGGSPTGDWSNMVIRASVYKR